VISGAIRSSEAEKSDLHAVDHRLGGSKRLQQRCVIGEPPKTHRITAVKRMMSLSEDPQGRSSSDPITLQVTAFESVPSVESRLVNLRSAGRALICSPFFNAS
jgi:hypothetical protein